MLPKKWTILNTAAPVSCRPGSPRHRSTRYFNPMARNENRTAVSAVTVPGGSGRVEHQSPAVELVFR